MSHHGIPEHKRCTHRSRKVRYPDKRAADHALHFAYNARTRADNDGALTRHREIRAYECPVCAGYHLTSQAA